MPGPCEHRRQKGADYEVTGSEAEESASSCKRDDQYALLKSGMQDVNFYMKFCIRKKVYVFY